MSEREEAERTLRPREIIVSSSTTRSHCSSADWQLAPIQVDATEKASPSNGRGKYIHPVSPLSLSLSLSLSPRAPTAHTSECASSSRLRARGRSCVDGLRVASRESPRREQLHFGNAANRRTNATKFNARLFPRGIEAEEGEREGGERITFSRLAL